MCYQNFKARRIKKSRCKCGVHRKFIFLMLLFCQGEGIKRWGCSHWWRGLFLPRDYQVTLASPVQKWNRNAAESAFSCKKSAILTMWIQGSSLWVTPNLLQDFSRLKSRGNFAEELVLEYCWWLGVVFCCWLVKTGSTTALWLVLADIFLCL